MQPYAMSSAYASSSMPFLTKANLEHANYISGTSYPLESISNGSIGGYFDGMKPRKNDCFTKMEYHMGRKHEGYMGNYNNFSMFGSQQSQFFIQGKYADANCGTGMMPSSYGYSGNGATGVPDFVKEMMKDFKQAFGDMGGAFGGEQSYAQTPVNYAGAISTPYAPIEANTLPAYQGFAPSPYMGGYDLSSTTPPPPPVLSTDLYGATAPAYSAPIDSSFINQYLAGMGGQYGAGNLGDLTSQYPQLGSAPMYYHSVAQQQYAA